MTTHAATRQTLSYLRTLFAERGIRPKNKLGQNFLIDLNLLDLLVRAAELDRADLALEVGSGTGSLTVRLAEQAGAVLSVEIDPAFAVLTEEAVQDRFGPGRPASAEPAVTLLHADALRNKNELNPELVTALIELRQRSGTSRIKLVSNLPYAVAVPVVSNLLLTDLPVERMVVTVQWEIAERLLARPGTKDYGALAVLVQSLAEVELVRRLPPAVFWPRPEVDSAIVRIVPDADKRAHVGDVGRFRSFLRDLYVHRRKNLRGALVARPTGRMDKAEVDRKLGELGIAGTARAEDLDLEQHLRLCRVFGIGRIQEEP
jgi:16S rRNA (adenine1518-N6/adenine1519-N6)-dimethyltransferase